MLTPVTNLKTSAGARLSTQRASAALARAPSAIAAVISARGERTSGRLPSALASVPAMKPAWTAIVSPALPPSPSAHSRCSAGTTAEALNQRERAPSSASDRTARLRQAAVTPPLLDDALLAELRDLLGRHAEPLQHLPGVLVGHRRRVPDRAGGVGELDRDADLPHAPVGGVLRLHDHLPVVDLGVAHHLFDVVDLADADVGLHEELVPVVPVAGLDDRLDLASCGLLLAVGGPHELIVPACEPREVGAPDRLAEVLPEPGLGAADRQELAVARLVDRVVGVGAAQETFPAPGRQAVREEEAHVWRRGEEGDARVEVGDVPVLAAPRSLAGEERQHDAEGAVQARARVIGDEVQRDRGLPVGLADEAEHARE